MMIELKIIIVKTQNYGLLLEYNKLHLPNIRGKIYLFPLF